MESKKLSKEILDFLDKYSLENAAFDPEFDEDGDRFNGPDSAMFYVAAKMLEEGRKPCIVMSSWGSGCYKTNLDDEGAKIHQHLLKLVNQSA